MCDNNLLMGKLRALNCLLQADRRCGYSVDDHRPRHTPRHRHCRWPHRRLLVQAVSGRYTLCNIAVANTTQHKTRVETSYSPQIYEYSGIWKYSNLINCDACFAMGTEQGPIAVAGASDGILYYTGMDKTCFDTSSWEFIRDSVVPDVHARRT